eukprot:5887035-Pleurochrysis_carterae.AAC.2
MTLTGEKASLDRSRAVLWLLSCASRLTVDEENPVGCRDGIRVARRLEEQEDAEDAQPREGEEALKRHEAVPLQ